MDDGDSSDEHTNNTTINIRLEDTTYAMKQ